MPIEKSEFTIPDLNGGHTEYNVYRMIPPASIKDLLAQAEADGLEGEGVNDVRFLVHDLTFPRKGEVSPEDAEIRKARIKLVRLEAAKKGYTLFPGFWHSVYIRTISPEEGERS